MIHEIDTEGKATPRPVVSRAAPEVGKDRYAFELPASVHADPAGYLIAGRFNGNLALTSRGDDAEVKPELSLSWFDAPIGMPAVAVVDRTATLVAPIAGKSALVGTTFSTDAKPEKPAPIVLGDDGAIKERTSLSVARSAEDTVLGFVEVRRGDKPAKAARVALLDGELKPRRAVLDLPGSEKAVSIKVVALEAPRAFAVVGTSGGELTATALECAP